MTSLIAALVLICITGAPARAAEDANIQVDLSKTVTYKNEQCTLTFSYADGRAVEECRIYLPTGVIRASGDTLNVNWSDFVDPSTGTVPNTMPSLAVKVKVGGIFRTTSIIMELANVERPGSTQSQPAAPPPAPEPAPTVTIESVWPEGAQGTLTYRMTASVNTDGCTLLGFKWYFGSEPKAVKTGQTWVNHTFAAYGDYPIRVVAEFEKPDNTIVTDYDEGTYTIGDDQPPAAKLQIKSVNGAGATWNGDRGSGAVPLKVTFTGEQSTDPEGLPLKAYYWYTDDDNTPVKTTTATYTHEYKSEGLFTPKLVVEDDWGNQSLMSSPVTVEVKLGEPQLAHTHDPQGAPADTINFQVFAPYEKDANAMTFDWNYGDGSGVVRGAAAQSSHTYLKLGQYTVTVECRYDYNDGSYTKVKLSKTFHAQGPISAQLSIQPQADSNGTVPSINALAIGADVTFSAYGSLSQYAPIVSYEFDLDGDGTYEHELSQPGIRMNCNEAGTFNARVRVTDERGNQADATMQYTVGAQAVVLHVSPQNGPPPLLVTCSAAGSSVPGGSINSYVWRITGPNGATSEDRLNSDVIVVTFDDPGDYTISVAVVDDRGVESIEVFDVVTVDLPVSALVVTPVIGSPPLTVTCDATGCTIPGTTVDHYIWRTHGMPGLIEENTTSTGIISLQFDESGTYIIEVTAVYAQGNESLTSEQIVTVANLPFVTINSMANVYTGMETRFNAYGTYSENGEIVSYEWDLHGNGFSGDASTISVNTTFQSAGTYTVRLQVTDEIGMVKIESTTVLVEDMPVQPETSIPWGNKHLIFTQ